MLNTVSSSGVSFISPERVRALKKSVFRSLSFAIAISFIVSCDAPSETDQDSPNATIEGKALSEYNAKAECLLDPLNVSIGELQDLQESGELTAVDLVRFYLARIDAIDKSGLKLNAIPVLNPNAIEEARRMDELRRSGISLGPLHGIPFVVKDSINVKGLPTSNGVSAFREFVPSEDAPVVRALRAGGGVLLGKANMTTLAGEGDGLSEAYGDTLNPYDVTRSPGGSSSGSASAVSAGLVPFSIGGETGGSIRWPADYQGLAAVKPSFGIIPIDGVFPLFPDRDVIGPMARSVEDLALIMDVVAVRSDEDPWREVGIKVEQVRPFKYSAGLDEAYLAGKRIGIPKSNVGKGDPESNLQYEVAPEILDLFDEARIAMQEAGAELVEVEIPALELWESRNINEDARAELNRLGVTDDVISEAFMVYIWNEYLAGFDTSFDELLRNMPVTPDWSPEDQARWLEQMAGGWPTQDQALNEFKTMRAAFEALRAEHFDAWLEEEGLDALVGPTVTFPAPLENTKWADIYDPEGPWGSYRETLNAAFEGNTLGLPTVQVSMGVLPDGIPTSLQFIGPHASEPELLRIAHAFEKRLGISVYPESVAQASDKESLCAD